MSGMLLPDSKSVPTFYRDCCECSSNDKIYPEIPRKDGTWIVIGIAIRVTVSNAGKIVEMKPPI
jgi:hypothetical protein